MAGDLENVGGEIVVPVSFLAIARNKHSMVTIRHQNQTEGSGLLVRFEKEELPRLFCWSTRASRDFDCDMQSNGFERVEVIGRARSDSDATIVPTASTASGDRLPEEMLEYPDVYSRLLQPDQNTSSLDNSALHTGAYGTSPSHRGQDAERTGNEMAQVL